MKITEEEEKRFKEALEELLKSLKVIFKDKETFEGREIVDRIFEEVITQEIYISINNKRSKEEILSSLQKKQDTLNALGGSLHIAAKIVFNAKKKYS